LGKHENKGFTLHGFAWQCHMCCCFSCTGRKCPYRRGSSDGLFHYRCIPCRASYGDMSKCMECDFFENKHTSSRHFKIKRKIHREDAIISRLDKIMQKLDVPADELEGITRHNYISDDAARLVDVYNHGFKIDNRKK